MKRNLPISHGDVNLIPVSQSEWEKIIKSAKEINHKGSFVIALGEQTGHKHKITVERPETMKIYRMEDGRGFIVLSGPGTLDHEEHGTLTVPAGIYEDVRERERDWFSLTNRKVVD